MSLTIVAVTISPNTGEKIRQRNSRLVLSETLLIVTSVVTATVMVGVMVMDDVGNLLGLVTCDGSRCGRRQRCRLEC